MVINPKSLLNEKISNSNCGLGNTFDSPKLSSSLENNLEKPYKTVEKISPYLNGTKLQILSQMTEKKIVQKKFTDITSSFAQACKIYKANSDEFKCVKEKSRKVKTSISNKFADPAIPQTVSDINDSEYLKRVDNNRKYKQRKHRVTKSISYPHDSENYEFFNGDLLRCPGPKVNSNSLNKNKTNNCKRIKSKKKAKGSENTQPSDVWAMLRDINRFQWISSPPVSDDSVTTIKKKRKYRKSDKEVGFIETCTTEEFSYVSSYDINSKSQSILSQPSSFDRKTIIDTTADLNTQESIRLNPKSSKKSACRTKQTKIKGKKVRNDPIKLCNEDEIGVVKKVNDTLNYNKYTDFKKCFSKETLNSFSNRYESQNTLLDSYDVCTKDTNVKDQCKKITSIKSSAYELSNDIMETYDRKPNDQLLGDIEKSSRAGLKDLSKASLFNKHRNLVPKIPEVLRINGKESTRDRAIEAQRNPRVPLINPKLTQTEIRRRLANLKFPIVILGKDEISSNFHVVPRKFGQFNGMDQQIWPFMVEWLNDLKINKSFINQNSSSTNCKYKSDVRSTPNDNAHNVIDKNKTPRSDANVKKELKLINEKNIDDNKNNKKSRKSNVLGQFRNKILGFISNKDQKNLMEKNDDLKLDTYQVSIDCKNNLTHPNNDMRECSKTLGSFPRQPERKYSWSKRKWTSDFIDNIFKKMKKGIYYTHNSEDMRPVHNNGEILETKSSMDADTECENVKEEMTIENTDDISIPGFENTQNFAPLIVEIKMLSHSRISIHHCLTNVMLQFDIIIPSGLETISSLSLSSFTPMSHEDKTMLYKCKSSLSNAILPAQLCSVLPKLLTQINKAHKILQKETNVPSSLIAKTVLRLPNAAQRLTEGIFSKRSPLEIISMYTKNENFFSCDYYSYKKYIMKLLPTIKMEPLFVPMNKYINFVISKHNIADCDHNLILNKSVINHCKALVPYVPSYTTNSSSSNLRLFLRINDIRKKFLVLINFMLSVKNSEETSNSVYYHNLNHLNSLRPNTTAEITINVSVSNEPFKLFYGLNNSKYRCIEYNQNNLNNENMNGATKNAEQKSLKNNKRSYRQVRKHLKKSFKTHKKCKSMTSMVKENDRTLLNKIVTLEDFFQALGCCKQLTTVLRGYSEKKILSSITEMKFWINEITRAQALLVLLLASKKETKNLKRFRPMLLQGIAVNRISTATELDMEIEVIEKENICVSQNEGISLLSTSNGNNLLDELYWIAKTTASDYQKPFDDSSKKLLKSLLEKRKKLNPSYLRVMARYVGLGLLKPRRNCL